MLAVALSAIVGHAQAPAAPQGARGGGRGGPAMVSPQVNPDKPVSPIYGFAIAMNPHLSEEKQKQVHEVMKFVLKDAKTWYERTAYPYPYKNFLDLPGMDEARRTNYLDVFIHDISIGRFVQRSPQIIEINEAIHRAMERVVLRNEVPKRSLDQACTEISRALAER